MTIRQTPDFLDETDRRLLELLRDNSRLPTATLAKRLNVSRGTVQNRLDRLIAHGILLGFTVRLQSDVETGLVQAITTLEVRSSDSKPVLAQLKRIPEVSRVYATNGRWDLVVEIRAADLVALDRVLVAIRGIAAISHSETNILLTELR